MRYLSILAALVIVLVISACSQSPAYSGPTSSTAAPPVSSSAASAPVLPSAGQNAEAGKTLFAARCSGCHGDLGQGNRGPAIIGANAGLAKYNTAQGLFDFISTAMPLSAPGSLQKQDYLNVLSFLLVQNNILSAASAFNPDQLQAINLKNRSSIGH